MLTKTFLNIPTVDAVKNAPKFSASTGVFPFAESQTAFCTCIFGVQIATAGWLAHFLMRGKNCVIFVNFQTR
jgi:hypothetical protein